MPWCAARSTTPSMQANEPQGAKGAVVRPITNDQSPITNKAPCPQKGENGRATFRGRSLFCKNLKNCAFCKVHFATLS